MFGINALNLVLVVAAAVAAAQAQCVIRQRQRGHTQQRLVLCRQCGQHRLEVHRRQAAGCCMAESSRASCKVARGHMRGWYGRRAEDGLFAGWWYYG